MEQLYEIEKENPPFVGSKLAVFNQSKRLSYRFLQLPYHQEFEIAKALKFVKDGDNPLSKNDLAQVVFKLAREKGKLAELWNLVAAQYTDGSMEENPFKTSLE